MAKRHEFSLGLKGSGYAIQEYGLLRILDGHVILCGTNLADFAKEFDGRWVELMICAPSPSDPTPVDPLILPLLERLWRRGLTTVSSCQGHLDPDIYWRFPFVTFWGKPDIPVADTWEIEPTGQTNLWNLRAKGIANTDAELAALQSRIADQLGVLG